MDAYSRNGGDDEADSYDSAGDDTFRGVGDLARLTGEGFRNQATGFGRIKIRGVNGGQNRLDLDAVDYIFTQLGEWT